MKFYIKYGRNIFEYADNSEDACWYDFDGVESRYKNKVLILDADRDVYATLTDGNKEISGVIGDEENISIADNYPIKNGYTYKFRKCKKGYYI